MDGGEIEGWLRDDHGDVVQVDRTAFFGENVVPDGFLGVPVEEVALLEGQHVVEAGYVSALVDLVTNEGPSSLTFCLRYAIGHYTVSVRK